MHYTPKLEAVPVGKLIPQENGKARSRVDHIASSGTPGVELPPILVRRAKRAGETVYYVIDGHHRRLAAMRKRTETIAAWVLPSRMQIDDLWGDLRHIEVEWNGKRRPYADILRGVEHER